MCVLPSFSANRKLRVINVIHASSRLWVNRTQFAAATYNNSETERSISRCLSLHRDKYRVCPTSSREITRRILFVPRPYLELLNRDISRVRQDGSGRGDRVEGIRHCAAQTLLISWNSWNFLWLHDTLNSLARV